MLSMETCDITNELSNKIANMGIVCAALVVALHIPIENSGATGLYEFLTETMKGGACQLAVPFFFCASGFLFVGRTGSGGWYARALRKRIRTLLVPYLLLNGGWYFYRRILATVTHSGKDLNINLCSFVECFGFDLTHWTELGPLWYVRFLLILSIFAPMIVYGLAWLGRERGCVLVFALFCGYSLVNYWSIHGSWSNATWDFWRYGISVRGCFWFALGSFIRMFPLGEWFKLRQGGR